MTQFEFYKSFQFVIELLVAEGLFCLHLERRRLFVLRLLAGLIVTFTVSYLFPVSYDNAFYVSFMFFALFAVTVVVAKFLFREAWLKIIFCMIAAYTVQHLAYELYNLSLIAMGVGDQMTGMYGDGELSLFPNPFIAVIYFFIYFVVYFFAFLLFGNRIRGGEKLQLKSGFIFVFVALILVVDIILNAVVVFYIAADGNDLYLAVVGIYNALCCAVALFLQFEVSLRAEIEDTLNAVTLLRHKEKEQYETSKENIALINMKCHDLKHQIRSIGSRISISEESVKEIENLISIYDSGVQTGNDALDTILTEKRLFCNNNGIKLSCIADGKQLNFMKDEDIYSLFGNIIDNAIEAVQQLEEGKRVIGLRVRAIDSLLSVNVHNYYEKELEFENGMPKTTKPEKEYHGFGLKSVRHVCDKYGGDLSINADHQVFNVNIMFSLDKNETI